MLHNFTWHSLLFSTWKSRFKKMSPYFTEKQCKIFPMQLNFYEIVWQSKLQEQHYFFFFLKVSKERNFFIVLSFIETNLHSMPSLLSTTILPPQEFWSSLNGATKPFIQNCLGGKELSNLASEMFPHNSEVGKLLPIHTKFDSFL